MQTSNCVDNNKTAKAAIFVGRIKLFFSATR